MNGSPEHQAAPRSVLRRHSVRIALWLSVLVAVVVYRAWSDWSIFRDTVGLRFREASAEEWQKTIAELGQELLAKEVSWMFIRHDLDHEYHGRLVWWHDGTERLSYLPSPEDENPRRAFLQLIGDLRHGRGSQPPPVVILNLHGDATLVERVLPLSMAGEEPPPSGWTILRAPGQQPRH